MQPLTWSARLGVVQLHGVGGLEFGWSSQGSPTTHVVVGRFGFRPRVTDPIPLHPRETSCLLHHQDFSIRTKSGQLHHCGPLCVRLRMLRNNREFAQTPIIRCLAWERDLSISIHWGRETLSFQVQVSQRGLKTLGNYTRTFHVPSSGKYQRR